MRKKSHHPNFDQTIELLRSRGFDAKPFAGVPGGMLVSKHGAGTVLTPAGDGPAACAVSPGALVNGEVARLLDRGYQKFIKTSQFEIPATAGQLHAVHAFSEELKELTGEMSLYNESLGTTGDVYRYDRLQGREAEPAKPVQPWQPAASH